MERKAFLLALFALPFFIYDEKNDYFLGRAFRKEQRELKIKENEDKLIDGHRPRRGSPPQEPWEREENEYTPFDFFPEYNPLRIRKWQKNYNPKPLQYWGTEPIEDTDLLG